MHDIEITPGDRFQWLAHPDQPALKVEGIDGLGALAAVKATNESTGVLTSFGISEFRTGIANGKFSKLPQDCEKHAPETQEAALPGLNEQVTIQQTDGALLGSVGGPEESAETDPDAYDTEGQRAARLWLTEQGYTWDNLPGHTLIAVRDDGSLARSKVVSASRMLGGLRCENEETGFRFTLRASSLHAGALSGHYWLERPTLAEEILGPEICAPLNPDEVGASLMDHLAAQVEQDWPPELLRTDVPAYAPATDQDFERATAIPRLENFPEVAALVGRDPVTDATIEEIRAVIDDPSQPFALTERLIETMPQSRRSGPKTRTKQPTEPAPLPQTLDALRAEEAAIVEQIKGLNARLEEVYRLRTEEERNGELRRKREELLRQLAEVDAEMGVSA